MPQNSRNHKLSRAALSAISGITLVIAGAVAVHAGDGNDDGSDGPYTKFFHKMLSVVGLREPDRAGIDYKERPPLVVPPSRDLPAPVPHTSPAAKNSAWPTDPDGKRRTADPNRDAMADRRVLAGAKADDPTPPPPPGQQGGSQQGGWWSNMTGWTRTFTGNNNESATFVREPPRNDLTDPPAGYRTPASSQPYGINGLADKDKNKTGADRQNDIINGPPK